VSPYPEREGRHELYRVASSSSGDIITAWKFPGLPTIPQSWGANLAFEGFA
jgi:hypothetical protein